MNFKLRDIVISILDIDGFKPSVNLCDSFKPQSHAPMQGLTHTGVDLYRGFVFWVLLALGGGHRELRHPLRMKVLQFR